MAVLQCNAYEDTDLQHNAASCLPTEYTVYKLMRQQEHLWPGGVMVRALNL